MSSESLVVIYAYYEKNEQYRQNLLYFLEHGYLKDPNIDYYFIVNGKMSVVFPTNVTVIFRENVGFDFAGWNEGINRLTKVYDYYFFINTSVRGPFINPNVKWFEPFINLLKSSPDIKLVGSTLCPLDKGHRLNPVDKICPHIQSYTFVMDHECLTFLRANNLFSTSYSSIYDVVKYQELMMSALVIANNWNISCLVPEYQNIDYRTIPDDFKPIPDCLVHGAPHHGKTCFDPNLHPYEVVFVKTSNPFITTLINQNI